SDLERAVQTARIAVPYLEPVLCPELREWHLGVLQKHTREEAKALFPNAWEILCHGTFDDRKIPGGESMNDMIARSVDLVNRVVAKHKGGRILLVSHGGTIRAMRRGLLQEDDVPGLSNASLSRLDYCGGQWTVQFWNECGFLDELLSSNGEH
ncbi:MAG: histidine phosphatase family protein, partial [Victivallales bacterium]|nr:histidine phosphatase family protein [Victivallales bacterium]